MKTCRICNQEKDESEFNPPNTRKVCKNCQKKQNLEYRQKHKQDKKEYDKQYRSKNLEKRRQKNRDWAKNNKKRKKITDLKRYLIKRNEILAKNKIYRQIHQKELNKKHTIYIKNKRYNDINFKITGLLRHQVWSKIKNQNGKKSNHTLELLGCSLEFLKEHLQQTAVQNGYLNFNINNYSGQEYHIDHIIPCSAFNLKCSFHQKLCFNWSNLQILSAKENLYKKNKIID